MTVTDVRNETSVPVTAPLAQRWSPRALDGSFELDAETLTALGEAARWAPSAANLQPTHFIVARRGTDSFGKIVASLAGFNQVWAPRASALVVAIAETRRDGSAMRWAEYDLGQAVAHLTIEAAARDLVTHQMGGFDADALSTSFGLAENLVPVTVTAIGRYDAKADIPAEVHERDRAPRTRRELDEMTVLLDF